MTVHIQRTSGRCEALTLKGRGPQCTNGATPNGRCWLHGGTQLKVATACLRCGEHKEACEYHHIRARSEGGTELPDNIAPLCMWCHKEWHQFFDVFFASDTDLVVAFQRFLNTPPYWFFRMLWRLDELVEELAPIRKLWENLVEEKKTESKDPNPPDSNHRPPNVSDI